MFRVMFDLTTRFETKHFISLGIIFNNVYQQTSQERTIQFIDK